MIPPEFSKNLQDFKTEVDSVSASMKLLENFANDYFMTLNESGYAELNDILEALLSSYTLCNTLASSNTLAEGQMIQGAQEIINFVHKNQGKGIAPSVLSAKLSWAVPLLSNWKERFETRIDLIDKKLKLASKQFQSVGAVRTRKRSPTSVILGEVRKNIFGKTSAISPAGWDKKK